MVDKSRANEIIEKHYQAVYRQVLSSVKGNEDAAHDITHDTFQFFLESLNTLEDRGLYSWIMRVSWNKTMEYFRSSQKAMGVVELDESYMLPVEAECWDEYFADEKVKEHIRKLAEYKNAISKLNPDEKAFLRCVVENKFNYKPVAEQYNTTRKNVAVRMCRLREKLVSYLPKDLRAPFLVFFLFFWRFYKFF